MLTFVPTPLGNLRDVTLRALDELRECDLIVAEDTRVARRLLAALDLPSKPLRSYREANAGTVTAELLALARERRIAVVTDAGMPGISDPGAALIDAARAAGIAVEVLPGPCAFVTAAVLSGFHYDELIFAGFVPRRAGERGRALERALTASGITAFYESPQRIVATLEALDTVAPGASAFLVRELTKKFEQQLAGNARAILTALEQPVRGEIVLIVAGSTGMPVQPGPSEAGSLGEAIDAALAGGASAAAAAKSLAKRGFGDRSEIYRRIVARVQSASRHADDP